MKRIFFLLILLASCSFALKANEPDKNVADHDTSFFDLSLEQLMNIDVSVGSYKSLSPRESPGIITVITEDEIKLSGAHDIMDILKLVPGFDFACDVEGVIGLGIRGNWAHEGKVLLLIDGQEMNEALYSTLQFGNHYPVEQIKKIEIIRGPGSASYGGNAEYSVINIITRNNKEFTGLSAAVSYGQTAETYSHRNVSITAGHHFGEVALNIGALIGEGNRSDKQYTDVDGQTLNLAGKQNLDPSFFEAALTYKNFSMRAIADVYKTTTIDGYDKLFQYPYPNNFSSYYFETKYTIQLNEKLAIIPRINLSYQTPWNYTGVSVNDEYPQYNKTAQRSKYTLLTNYEANDRLHITGGIEYFNDMAKSNSNDQVFNSGETKVAYQNIALYGQALYSSKLANLTVGVRVHDNEKYETSFVPRIALTKVIDKFHGKILLSKAYRAPGIENIDLGSGIQPENTNVAELEVGYQLNEKHFLSLNLYDITTSDVIVYYYDNKDSYKNSGSSGTKGIELSLKRKGISGYADLSYSFYTTANKSVVNEYSIGDRKDQLLAFPAHKINLSGTLKLTKNMSFSGSLAWQSDRYAFDDVDSVSNKNLVHTVPPTIMANAYLHWTNFITKGFSLGIGCNNIFNQDELFIQPYNSYHLPLPGMSREFRIRLAYELKSF